MNEPGEKFHIPGNTVFILVCVCVIGILIWSAEPGYLEFEGHGPSDAYYNLLVQGFRAGQLNMKRDPSPGLAQLPNPYDSRSNKSYVWDPRYLSYEMSYYKGKLYLYYGVAPAVVLFWPYVTVTGHYLSHRNGCVIFAVLGFAAAASVIYGIWRRYFPETSPWVAALGVLALGLAAGLLEILSSCDVYEVAITCGFAFVMMAVAAIFRALHERERALRWLAWASLGYGLAVGARPSLLFGSIILLIPVAGILRREWGRISFWRGCLLFAAAIVPLTVVGLGLMLYNFLRFGSPLEFGWHYQLTDFLNGAARQFSLGYLWFNFRFYFLEPIRFIGHFPFLQAGGMPPLPAGYGGAGTNYGVLGNYPIALLALAAPLAWRGRAMEESAGLRWFASVLLALFAICAGTLFLFFAASSRYELDFLPTLWLLAVIGIFGLERALAQSAVRRTFARFFWGLAVGYTVVFNVVATVDAHAATHYFVGNFFFHQGSLDKAIEDFDKASTLQPNDAGFHFSLANALSQSGRTDEAVVQFQKALEIEPNFPEANNNLAFTLLQAGRLDDAIKYFQRASQLQKTYQTVYNLAFALRMNRMGMAAETNLQKAIELQPDFMPAQLDLSWMLATWPDATARDGARALAIAKNLNQQHPEDPKILRTLAAAYAETGDFPEAVSTAEQALTAAQTQSRTALAKQLQAEIGLYKKNAPSRSFGN